MNTVIMEGVIVDIFVHLFDLLSTQDIIELRAVSRMMARRVDTYFYRVDGPIYMGKSIQVRFRGYIYLNVARNNWRETGTYHMEDRLAKTYRKLSVVDGLCPYLSFHIHLHDLYHLKILTTRTDYMITTMTDDSGAELTINELPFSAGVIWEEMDRAYDTITGGNRDIIKQYRRIYESAPTGYTKFYTELRLFD